MYLLAEDNAINQKVTLNILKRLGYQADVANNGQEVIEALTKKLYDLVLMDIQMPDMDGLEASRIIRDPSSSVHCHTIPIIAVTAHAMENDKKRCLEAGMDDYLPKPIDQKKLTEKITKWLSVSRGN